MVKKEWGGIEHSAKGIVYCYFREFWKLVIWRHSRSRSSRRFCRLFSLIKSLIRNMIKILAFSKVDLLAMFKNWMNSFFDEDPEPSAILFDMDIPAPLSWSAKRYNLFFSSSSAISNSSLAIWMANCQIFKSWNLNLAMVYMIFCATWGLVKPSWYSILYAPCALPYADTLQAFQKEIGILPCFASNLKPFVTQDKLSGP